MRIMLDDGRFFDVSCMNFESMWHHCVYFGNYECGEDCPKWKDEDWLCRVMCE